MEERKNDSLANKMKEKQKKTASLSLKLEINEVKEIVYLKGLEEDQIQANQTLHTLEKTNRFV